MKENFDNMIKNNEKVSRKCNKEIGLKIEK